MTENQQRLRTLMETHKVTYRKLAKIINRHPSTITSWLTTPDKRHYRKLSDANISYIENLLKGNVE